MSDKIFLDIPIVVQMIIPEGNYLYPSVRQSISFKGIDATIVNARAAVEQSIQDLLDTASAVPPERTNPPIELRLVSI
jgi:hypothetical protein